MKQRILEFSAILLAATLAGGVRAASDSKQKNSRAHSPEERVEQSANQTRSKPAAGDIQSAVEKKLQQLDGIDTSQLKVETSGRTVTITGTIDRLIESDRIMEAVSAMRGVDNVITRYTVEAEDRPDRDIQRDVQAALEFDPATSAKDIQVAVKEGGVRLTGKADSWSAKQLATWIVSDVRGVRKIDNDLTVTSKDRSDPEIKEALAQRFRSDPLVSDDIAAEVDGGRVQLSGQVGSALEKQWAIADARALNVAEVDASQLRVNPDGRASGSHAGKALSDEEIADSIRHAYVNDPRVFSFNPEVNVKDGTVELGGTVDNLKAKQAAVQIAEKTEGVDQVKDYLSIRGKAWSDGHVAQVLRDALERSALVDAEDIVVQVTDGRVTLTGDVDSNLEKWAAGDVAARTRGVNEVRNQLIPTDLPEFNISRYYYYPWHSSYSPWTFSTSDHARTDAELQQEVRDELTWSPFADAEDIAVSVDGGVVTLSGQVDSRMEKGAAEDNAYQAGATRVKNDLVVVEPTGR